MRELDHEISVLQSPEYRTLFAEGNRLAEQLDAFQAVHTSSTNILEHSSGSNKDSPSFSVRQSHVGTLDK